MAQIRRMAGSSAFTDALTGLNTGEEEAAMAGNMVRGLGALQGRKEVMDAQEKLYASKLRGQKIAGGGGGKDYSGIGAKLGGFLGSAIFGGGGGGSAVPNLSGTFSGGGDFSKSFRTDLDLEFRSPLS